MFGFVGMSENMYRVLSISSDFGFSGIADRFTGSASRLINDGWIPCGGITCLPDKHRNVYMQAFWKPPTIEDIEKKITSARNKGELA